MKNRAIAILIALIASPALGGELPVAEGWICLDSQSAFEDADMKANGIRLNNFSISEGDVFLGGYGITFSYSITNRNSDPMSTEVQLATFDANGKLLFVSRGAPAMDRIQANTTETATGTAFVTKGTLSRVVRYCIAPHFSQ